MDSEPRFFFSAVPVPEASKLIDTPFRVVPLIEGERGETRVVQRGDSFEDPQLVDVASGVKVWEGGVDLARFVAKLPDRESRFLEGCRVLELGAGHALPGLTAARRWRRAVVHYHDMSEDVLREVTAFNLAANGAGFPPAAAPGDSESCEPRFLSGDWHQLRETAKDQGLKYDVILAADVIYKTDFYDDLLLLLEQCLVRCGPPESPSSLRATACFCGKRFYFGCGGGTASFATFLRERGFDVDVACTIEDGRSNVREVLKVRRRSDQATCRGSLTSVSKDCSSDCPGDSCGEQKNDRGDVDEPPNKKARDDIDGNGG